MSGHPSAEELLAAKAEFLVPCVCHFYKEPPVIVRGEGVHLFDTNGKRYLDCYSGVTVMSADHSNQAIQHATIKQLENLQHTTTIYLTEGMFRLAERLSQITPGAIRRSFFCASGTEANEAAMLIATLATGRQGFIALTDSLHGRTKWAMSATGLDLWRTDAHLLDSVRFAPHACRARCPLDVSFPECGYACVQRIEQCIEQAGPDAIAALIAEPIQGNGGVIVPPDGYWQEVRALCDRHGILLIFDEIQCGLNRTGRWYACEHWEVEPDIITTAKALGNGIPIAAMMTTDAIAGAYAKPGASTFGANPVACATALAVLDFHERERLGARSAELGAVLLRGLEGICIESPYFRHARGKGLMAGVEVVDESGAPDATRCDLYLERLKDAGFFAGKTGRHRNTLTFMPPLIITEEEVGQAIGAVMDLNGE